MDDILITLGIIALVLFQSYRKMKKKEQQQASRKKAPQPETQPYAPLEEEKEDEPFPFGKVFSDDTPDEENEFETVVTSTAEENPKNVNYFTYETIDPEVGENIHTEENCSNNTVENNVQNVDNETVKNQQNIVDLEELYKGVIYSEILKRPYN